jgi:hypothetical protein
MIRDFIAIDFETANQQPSSVCSIGVVMVRNETGTRYLFHKMQVFIVLFVYLRKLY